MIRRDRGRFLQAPYTSRYMIGAKTDARTKRAVLPISNFKRDESTV